MRSKPPQEILERRRKPPRKLPVQRPSKWRWDWKYWLATGLALIGLILGGIALRARPTISLEPPLDSRNVISTPIVISNDGMLALKDVEVTSFLYRIDLFTGVVRDQYDIGSGYIPPNKTLETGERETVNISTFLSNDFNINIGYADIGLIVTFRPEYTPCKRVRAFRLKTARQSDGTLRFEQQPAGDILEQYEKAVHSINLPQYNLPNC
jgi:hypothetical protein